MQNDEHKINLQELYKRLQSSVHGLSANEAINRQQKYGANLLEEKENIPIIIKFGKHLINFFAILLWIGAILAFTAEYFSPGDGNLYIGIALVMIRVKLWHLN